MRVHAPAKINLHLRVGPPAADGFHPLLTWMVTVGLFDTLELRLKDQLGIDVACDEPGIPLDGSNLIVKCAAAMLDEARAVGAAADGLSAVLRKRIPLGAGLGGGSSDGAAVISALDRMLQLGWPAAKLAELSARFGSDLPFFFFGPSSICTSRGQLVQPIHRPKPRWAVLMLPTIHMPTPSVYRKFDEMKLGAAEAVNSGGDAPDWNQWSSLNSAELLPRLVNDLEAPAFALNAQLEAFHSRATQLLGRIVRMSGSGSSLFTLFDDPDQARVAAQRARAGLGIHTVSVEICPELQRE